MSAARYQDLVIKDGQLVGQFEEMYQQFDDPWEQTTRERFASEKAVALNLIARLVETEGVRQVVELGCGFGDFTARIKDQTMHETGFNIDVTGVDISETAIAKARKRHPEVEFVAGSLADHDLLRRLAPDVIVMAEITWYVLDHLDAFLAFLKREMPHVYVIHLLMTYPAGVQQYGRDYFTDLDGIKRYFGFRYLESGSVESEHGTRTWFLGQPK